MVWSCYGSVESSVWAFTNAHAEQLAANGVSNLRSNFIIATASIAAGRARVGAQFRYTHAAEA